MQEQGDVTLTEETTGITPEGSANPQAQSSKEQKSPKKKKQQPSPASLVAEVLNGPQISKAGGKDKGSLLKAVMDKTRRPIHLTRRSVIAGVCLVALTLVVSHFINGKIGTPVYTYGNLALEAMGKDVDLTYEGVKYPIIRCDGMFYIPATPTLNAMGFEGAMDSETNTYVISRLYKGLARLADMDMSTNKTPAAKWFNLEGVETQGVLYGPVKEDGSRNRIDDPYGALNWENVDGIKTDTAINRITFDVSEYNLLSVKLLGQGNNSATFYSNGDNIPFCTMPVPDYEQSQGKPQTITLDISDVDSLSIGGYPTEDTDDGWILFVDPLLSK